MNSEQLQRLLNEVQDHIKDFKKTLRTSEFDYQSLLNTSDNLELNSKLMEHHFINVERQKESIARLETLRDHIQDELRKLRVDPKL